MKILCVLCALVLSVLSLGLTLSPAQSVSERENRVLATWEAPTWETLADGSFFSRLSQVCGDQFPKRGSWIAWKAAVERWLGKRENNGILFGEDGYLIAKGSNADVNILSENLEAIEALGRSASAPVIGLLVPRATEVLADFLPTYYEPSRAVSNIVADSGADDVGVSAVLREAASAGESVWYRTDHHWTTQGAYLAYARLAPLLGVTPYGEELFERQVVSESFFGSSDSAVGGVAERADTIVLYRYEGDEDFLVTDCATGETRRGFYDYGALEQKDQYRIFLGGNTGRLSVRLSSGESRPRLLVIKDSYANCLIPFLALHFDLEIIDPRYDIPSVDALLADVELEAVLLVQGVDTLASDSSLCRVLSRYSSSSEKK